MCKSDKKPFTTRNIVGYTLPWLHTGKNWYVDFFAYDPTIDRLKRKKFMLDKMAVNRLRQEWARVRKALGFPASYQFYSLKDSGIP